MSTSAPAAYDADVTVAGAAAAGTPRSSRPARADLDRHPAAPSSRRRGLVAITFSTPVAPRVLARLGRVLTARPTAARAA